MIRVVLVDDQYLVRAGLRWLLESEQGIELVGEAADGLAAFAVVGRVRPDVVLMDIRMPELDGIEATRRIVGSGFRTRVLVLTTYDLDEYVFAALEAGASGFLLKDSPAEDLVAAIGVVAAGEALLAPAVTRRVIDTFVRRGHLLRPNAGMDRLTPREREVFDLIVQGMSNSEICRHLYISEATTKTHVGNLLAKLGLRDRVQVVIHAYEAGLVVPGNPPIG